MKIRLPVCGTEQRPSGSRCLVRHVRRPRIHPEHRAANRTAQKRVLARDPCPDSIALIRRKGIRWTPYPSLGGTFS
jgi:hypothetical protein